MNGHFKNYLVLSGGALASRPMPPLVAQYLGPAAANRLGALLFLFESRFLPMQARDHQRNAQDLWMEAALHDYLNRFSNHDFRLVREGDAAQERGDWRHHPFAEHPEVKALARQPLVEA